MLVVWLFPWKKWPVPSVDLSKHSPCLFLHFLKFIPLQLHHFRSPFFPILLQPNFFSSRQDGMKLLGQKKLLTYKPHPGVKASPNAKIQVSCWPQTFGGRRNGGRWRHPNRNKRVVKAPNGLDIERIFEWCVLFFLVFLPLFWKLSGKKTCDLDFFNLNIQNLFLNWKKNYPHILLDMETIWGPFTKLKSLKKSKGDEVCPKIPLRIEGWDVLPHRPDDFRVVARGCDDGFPVRLVRPKANVHQFESSLCHQNTSDSKKKSNQWWWQRWEKHWMEFGQSFSVCNDVLLKKNTNWTKLQANDCHEKEHSS